MNHIPITGNLTKDPETHSPDGSEYTCIKFSIANNDESKKKADGSGYENIVSYFDVKHWTKNVQYWLQVLVKGASVLVQGRLKQERWTAEDGTTRSRVVIIAEAPYNGGFAIQVLPKHQKAEGSPAEEPEDDIPF